VALVRLEADGSLDQGFDGDSGVGNGVVNTGVSPWPTIGLAAAVQDDGRILVASPVISP